MNNFKPGARVHFILGDEFVSGVIRSVQPASDGIYRPELEADIVLDGMRGFSVWRRESEVAFSTDVEVEHGEPE